VGSTMAIYVTGTVVGGFSGRFIAGIVAHHWGWRAPLLFLARSLSQGPFATWRILPRLENSSLRTALPRIARVAAQPPPQSPASGDIRRWIKRIMLHGRSLYAYGDFYLADKPFYLGPAALAMIFAVYLVGAAVTPVAGRILDRVGYRRGLDGSCRYSRNGHAADLIHYVPLLSAGWPLRQPACSSARQRHPAMLAKAAEIAGSSATGLYVAFYYFGGFAGSILPGFFWKQTGWSGCVAIIICIQMILRASDRLPVLEKLNKMCLRVRRKKR